MKTELKAKYLQHLIKKKNKDEGFTLIELLVVIIIIGILAAIALPSFLNQAAKARGAEAKSNVGAMNRAQQSYFLEKQTFTNNVDDLGLSMKNSTDNFSYSASGATLGSAVTNFGTSRKADIKSYVGGTYYTAGATTGTGTAATTAQGSTSTILCEAKTIGLTPAAAPTDKNTCATTTSQIQ